SHTSPASRCPRRSREGRVATLERGRSRARVGSAARMASLDDKARRRLMFVCTMTLHVDRGRIVDAVNACRTDEEGRKLWLKHTDLPKLRPNQSIRAVESLLAKMPALTKNDFWWADAWRAEHGDDVPVESFLA